MTGEEYDMGKQDDGKGKDWLTYDIVLLQQLQVINGLASRELVKGWWEKKIQGDNIIEVYHEDGREAFINGVKMLKDCLVGESNGACKVHLETYDKWIKENKGEDELNKTEEGKEKLLTEKLKAYHQIFIILAGILRKGSQKIVYVERYK